MTEQTSDEITQIAREQFHAAYGEAFAYWNQIESALADVFSMLTGMHPLVARSIFYSATSFRGRTDMMSAALSDPAMSSDVKDTIKILLKVCIRWASSRNILAHEVPMLDLRINSISSGQYVLRRGSQTYSQPSDGKKQFASTTVSDCLIMAANFRKLFAIVVLLDSDYSVLLSSEKLLHIREQLRALPNQAHSSE